MRKYFHAAIFLLIVGFLISLIPPVREFLNTLVFKASVTQPIDSLSGLAHSWSFDDVGPSGTEMYDNHPTTRMHCDIRAPSLRVDDGKFGKAYFLPGTDLNHPSGNPAYGAIRYATCPNPFNLSNYNNYSFEFWAKLPPDNSVNKARIDIQLLGGNDTDGNSSTGSINASLSVNPSGVSVGWFAGEDSGSKNCPNCWGLFGASQIPRNQWVHIVSTWKDEGSSNMTAALYINGKKLGSKTSGILTDGPRHPLFGITSFSSSNDQGSFGYLDEIRVYNRPLTDAEISSMATGYELSPLAPSDTPAHRWMFDEASGLSILDSGPDKKNGQISDESGVKRVAGRFGNALQFLPNTDSSTMPGYISFSSPLNISDRNDFSALMWVKFEKPSDMLSFQIIGGTIRALGGDGGVNATFSIAPSNIGIGWYAQGNSGNSSCPQCWSDGVSLALSLNTWHQVAVVFKRTGRDSLSPLVSVNGSLKTSSPKSSGLISKAGPNAVGNLFLGVDSYTPKGASGSVGFLDDLRFYNRSITIEEIKEQYVSCGNGELDSGEACDGSAGINVPHTVCSSDCKVITQNHCGDGIMQKPNEEKKGGPNNDGMEACDKDAGIDARYAYSYKFDEKCSDQCTVVNVPPTSGLEIKGFPIASELSGQYVATLKAVSSDRTKKLLVMLKGYNATVKDIVFMRSEENCQILSVSDPENYVLLSSEKGACYAKIALNFEKPGVAMLKVLQFYSDQEKPSEEKILVVEVQPPPPQIIMENSYAQMDQAEASQRIFCRTPYGLYYTTNNLKTQLDFEGINPPLKNIEKLGSLLRFVIPNPSLGTVSQVNMKFTCALQFTDDSLIIGSSEKDPEPVISVQKIFRFTEGDLPPFPKANIRDIELEVSGHDSGEYMSVIKQYGLGDIKPITYDATMTFSDPNVEKITFNFTVPKLALDDFQLDPCKVKIGSLYDPQSEGKRPWQLRNDVEAQYSMDGLFCQIHLNPKLIIEKRGLKPGDRFDLEQPFEMSLKHETIASEKRIYTFKIHAIYEVLKNPILTHAAPPATSPPVPPEEPPPAVLPKGGWNTAN